MSIIVDLYNLHLKEKPEEDKKQISDFLRTYTPRIFKYETGEDFLSSLKRDEKTGSYATDSKVLLETIGWYEFQFNKSWFDDNLDVFYSLYKPTQRIVDNFLDSRQSVSKEDAVWVNNLLKNIIFTLAISENQKELITFKQFPESIKMGKYTFEMTPTFRTSEINENLKESAEKIIQWKFPEIEYHLFTEFISLWNNNLNLKRCAFDGGKRTKPCQNILISTRGKEYCSKKCYNRARGIRQYLSVKY